MAQDAIERTHFSQVIHPIGGVGATEDAATKSAAVAATQTMLSLNAA
jgi:hypothetical protein